MHDVRVYVYRYSPCGEGKYMVWGAEKGNRLLVGATVVVLPASIYTFIWQSTRGLRPYTYMHVRCTM